MTTTLNLQGTGITDTGKKRSNNEDSFHCGWVADSKYLLALVVDGCGGYDGGEVAAHITCDTVVRYLSDQPCKNGLDTLKKAFVLANNRVYDARQNDSALKRMCCVATAVLMDPAEGVFHMAHIGDTRLYACAQGRIIKLSHDHSPIGREEEQGTLTEVEAMNSTYRNVIERAIGEKLLADDTDYIETASFPAGNGVTWLLCSDGLSDMVTTAEICDILDGEGTLEAMATELVEAANLAGGKDNITIVLIKADGAPKEAQSSMMDFYSHRMNPDATTSFGDVLKHVMVDTGDGKPVNLDDITAAGNATSRGGSFEDAQTEVSFQRERNASDEDDDSISHTDISEAVCTTGRRGKFLTAFKTVLALAIACMLIWGGIAAYQAYRYQRQAEDEAICQETLHRNLYYNVNNLQ